MSRQRERPRDDPTLFGWQGVVKGSPIPGWHLHGLPAAVGAPASVGRRLPWLSPRRLGLVLSAETLVAGVGGGLFQLFEFVRCVRRHCRLQVSFGLEP